MKIKDMIMYSAIFLLSILLTAEVVTYQLTGNHLFGSSDANSSVAKVGPCSNTPATQRTPTDDPQLKVINEYERVCESRFFNKMMIFTNMPISNQNAMDLADKMAARLIKFSEQGITPIVVVEPDSEWGLVDFHEFATGNYDEWIQTYFKRLQSVGITSEQIGIWMPFPEPQQPFWNNNSDPDDFAKSVNRYFRSLRSVFPKAKTAILLDSATGNEEASQLVAYTRLIDDSLINIAGVQGFPWHSDDENGKSVVDASKFLPAYMVEEVAKSLGLKEVIVNTGTYRHKKSQNGGDKAISTKEREETLKSIGDEVSLLQRAGYEVTVNIFAENKSDTKEGVDWSYWQPGMYDQSMHTQLFKSFVSQLISSQVQISIFDSRN